MSGAADLTTRGKPIPIMNRFHRRKRAALARRRPVVKTIKKSRKGK